MNELQNKILALKKERDCLILAHYYQPLEVQDIADAVGDSFALAKRAQSVTPSWCLSVLTAAKPRSA